MNDTTSRLRKKLKQATPDPYMGMSPAEVVNIREEAETLSLEERATLLSCFETPSGSVLHDVTGILADTLYIDDFSCPARRVRPLCLIERRFEGKVVVDVIDILETVRQNPVAIGHPAILAAINRWQAIIHSSKVLMYPNVYDTDRSVKKLRKQLKGDFIEYSKRNLHAVADALITGATKRAVTNKKALQLSVETLQVDAKNTYLYFAWERLHRRNIIDTQEAENRIGSIMDFLKKIPCVSDLADSTSTSDSADEQFVDNTSIELHWVKDFLCSAGKRFVYFEHGERSRRPKWAQFRNAFLAWYYDKTIDTIDKYRSAAKQQKYEPTLINPTLFAPPPPDSVFELISQQLTTPLVRVCPRVEIPGSAIDFFDVVNLINKKIA